MLMQKGVLGPRLGPVMASACEFEWAILFLIEAHPQAKKVSADYRQRMATSKNFAKLGKLLSILKSSCGIRNPHEDDYLQRCLLLRNLLVHGAYGSAAQTLSQMPRLRILEENVVSFDPPLGFTVPSFETALAEAMMFVNEPRLGAAIIEAFDAGCILLHLRMDQHYAVAGGARGYQFRQVHRIPVAHPVISGHAFALRSKARAHGRRRRNGAVLLTGPAPLEAGRDSLQVAMKDRCLSSASPP